MVNFHVLIEMTFFPPFKHIDVVIRRKKTTFGCARKTCKWIFFVWRVVEQNPNKMLFLYVESSSTKGKEQWAVEKPKLDKVRN